jgi:NTE family protein
MQPDVTDRFEIVALSGTSGGAICATLAWSALLDGDPTLAAPRLEKFWRANSASSPFERMMNTGLLAANRLADYIAMPALSPYDNPGATMGLDYFRSLLVDSIDFQRLAALATERGENAPVLLLGGVDVLSGDFHAFDSRRGEISADAILASAAIPTMFRTVHVGGGAYWDGLFSQNPPVHDLLDTDPDEIWVIQINPKARATEPRSMTEIADRRNELSGNLSLYQELRHIEEIDQLIEAGHLVGSKYRATALRLMEMDRSPTSQVHGTVSKMNRDPQFLAELIGRGGVRADLFCASLALERAWLSGDVDQLLEMFADDCEFSSSAPFAALPLTRASGRDAVRTFVTDRLANRVQVDLTHTQVASDRIEWRIRSTARGGGRRAEGSAVVEIRGGKVVGFHTGPITSRIPV